MALPAHMRGFARWEKNRRRQLRTDKVLDWAACSVLAIHERRVRVEIGKVIGKPRAKEIRLMACDGGRNSDLWFGFMLLDPIDPETWRKLQNIEGLFRPLERD